MMLTQERLKELLHYNPETGDFTWIVNRQRTKIGDIAGCINRKGYRIIGICGKSYRAHRLAWFYMRDFWPKKQIDHIDHSRDNNRWINIREATSQENHRNKPKYKTNTSGVTGVCWGKKINKWQVHINAKGKKVHLGLFTDKSEAICARKSAENKYGYHENHGS